MDETEKKPLSEKKAAALKNAQDAARAKFKTGDISPRALGQERARELLRWVLRWGYTTPTTAELLFGSQRSGIGNRLVNKGLLLKTPVQSGGINNTPSSFLTLTREGYDIATEEYGELLPYEFNPSKINQKLIPHNDTVQRLTIYYKSSIVKFHTEKELIYKSSIKELKQPDAAWEYECNGGKLTAIEVELTQKWGAELDRFVYMTLLSIYPKDRNLIRFSGAKIFAKNEALLKRYKEMFSPGYELQLWEKKEDGRYKKSGTYSVPKIVIQNIQFHRIDEGMISPPKNKKKDDNDGFAIKNENSGGFSFENEEDDGFTIEEE